MTMTPIEVVEAYNYELWNKQNYELGGQIIADEMIRHYPGKTVTLTRQEALQRVRDTHANEHWSCDFKLPKILVDGEYVTMFWENHGTSNEGDDFLYSSIEVFRVVDGQIHECWNPSYVEGPNGAWG